MARRVRGPAATRRRRRRWLALCLLIAVLAAVLATVLTGEDRPARARFRSLGAPGVGGRVTAISVQPGTTNGSDDEGTVLVAGDMLGAAWSSDLGSSWLPATGLLSYEMADFTWDPLNTAEVWVGSMSGPARSTDGGRTFAPARAGMDELSSYPYSSPVQRIVYLDGGNRIIAVGGSQRRWSEDNGHPERYGRIWYASRANASSPWSAWALRATLPGNVVTASRSGNHLYAVVRGGSGAGVYRSDDDGETFTRLGAPAGSHDELSDLAVHPLDSATLWVARAARSSADGAVIPGGTYRSTDAGATWTDVSPPTDGSGGVDQVSGFEAIEASATVPAGGTTASGQPVLYTSDVGQDRKTTYRSDDGGGHWTAILTEDDVHGPSMELAYSGGADMFTLAVDPDDPYLVFGGSEEHLLSGRADPANLAAGTVWTDRASRRNPDGSWSGRGFDGLVATRAVFNRFRPGVVSLNAMDGGNLLQSFDGGRTWRRPLAASPPIRSEGDAWMDSWFGAYDTTYADEQTVYVLKGQIGWFAGVAKSTDGGQTFTVLERAGNGLPTGIDFADHQTTAIEALRPDEVVLTMEGCLWRSIDGGANWAKEPATCPLGLGDLVRDPTTPTTLFAQGSSAVYRSLDAGRTFTPLSGKQGGARPGATAGNGRLGLGQHADRRLVLYASSTEGAATGLYRWDGAAGWTRVAANQAFSDHIGDVAVDPTNPDRVAAVVADRPFHDQTWAPGVLLSVDGGATWTVVSDGLGQLRAAAVAWDPFTSGRLVVGTYGQGFSVITVD